MTVHELHVTVDQKLDSVSSQLFRDLERGEKDLWLNLGQDVYVKRKVSAKSNRKQEGHQATRKNVDAVESLIKRAALSAYVEDSESTFSVVPHDYFLPNEIEVDVMWACGTISPTTSNVTETYARIPFPFGLLPSGGTGKYFQGLVVFSSILTVEEDVLFSIAEQASYFAAGLTYADEADFLIELMRQELNKNNLGISFHWEEFAGLNYPNEFIASFIYTDYNVDTFSIGSTVDDAYTDNEIEDFIQARYVNNSSYSRKVVPARMVNHEFKRELLRHPFGKTTHKSPLCVVRGGKIICHHDTTFVPMGLNFYYYKKPRRISYLLNQTCELNDATVQDEIVNVTVELLAKYLGKTNVNLLTEQALITE